MPQPATPVRSYPVLRIGHATLRGIQQVYPRMRENDCGYVSAKQLANFARREECQLRRILSIHNNGRSATIVPLGLIV
jgi:hypothetical protein